MKTITLRLLAIITLAAVITTPQTTFAQRRATENKTEESKKLREDRKNVIREKNNHRDQAFEKDAEIRKLKPNREVTRNKNPHNDYQTPAKQLAEKNSEYIRGKFRNEHPENQRESRYQVVDHERKNNNLNNDRSSYNNGVSNREKYHIDNNDPHFNANHNYRGSNKYWSGEVRNNYHPNRDNVKKGNHNDWDRNWETYRWNKDSWCNYYSYYEPYAYRNNKYYYYNPYYGHIIRKFTTPPMVFIHDHHKYYCYQGHFFRYRHGLGYILVDIPYGLTFSEIPVNYELVNINGYLYYRVGNLFLEYTANGYQLIHYPERYYSYDDHYINGGFNFEITIN